MSNRRPKQEGGEESQARKRFEAVAAILGAIAALATLGIIVWDGIRGDDGPPELTVETVAVHEQGGSYVLEILVSNSGDNAAAAVTVRGELSRDGEVIAESEASFDYVASRSRRRGGLIFAEDPRDYQVTVRTLGYTDP
jgi:uncharacterized protein (TIGR02588 family)